MCLSIPSKVLSIDENNFAIVETLGIKRGVSLDLISQKGRSGRLCANSCGLCDGKNRHTKRLRELKNIPANSR